MQLAVLPMSTLPLEESQLPPPSDPDHSSQMSARKHARSTSSVESPMLRKKQSRMDLSQSTPPKHDFICILNPQGKVQHTSPSVEDFLGFHSSDLVGILFTDLIHPQDLEPFTSGINSSMYSGTQLHMAFRVKLRSDEYSYFDILGRPFYNDAQVQGAMPPSPDDPIQSSGRDSPCRGIVLILRPRFAPSPSSDLSGAAAAAAAAAGASNNSSLWARRQAARMQKGRQGEDDGFDLGPGAAPASQHHHSDMGHHPMQAQLKTGGVASPPNFNLSVFTPPAIGVPQPTSTATVTKEPGSGSAPGSGHGSVSGAATSSGASRAPGTLRQGSTGQASPVYMDSGSNVSTHTLILDPATTSSVPSSAITSYPNSSLPSSIPSATLSSTTTYFDDPLVPPFSATSAEFAYQSDLPSPRYSYSLAAGRSHSVSDFGGHDALSSLPYQLDDPHRSGMQSPFSPMYAPPAVGGPGAETSSTASVTPNLYTAHSSTTDLSQFPGAGAGAGATRPSDDDPLAGAYWDNTANSELVSPQYYQPSPSSFLQHQYPVSSQPVSGGQQQYQHHRIAAMRHYVDQSQIRGKSYSLPGTLDAPRPPVMPMQYQYANDGSIDFSGYSMSKQLHHHHSRPQTPVDAAMSMGVKPIMAGRRKSKLGTSHHHHHHGGLEALGGESRHVCDECGAMESPEWRKGPKGPKTLCNACGLRWAKKTRKDQDKK